MKFTHVQELQLQDGKGIILMNAIDAAGPFYLYMRVEKENIQRLSRAYHDNESLDFSKYGEILHCGSGKIPPAHIRARMEKKYGFVH